jgi:hypothetical protein
MLAIQISDTTKSQIKRDGTRNNVRGKNEKRKYTGEFLPVIKSTDTIIVQAKNAMYGA